MDDPPIPESGTLVEMVAGAQSWSEALDADADEMLPHVVLMFDPELADPDAPWLGCGQFVTGPYPDRMAALVAAETASEGVNRGNGPGDKPWRCLVLAVHPLTDFEVPTRG